eukprot:CAMPEP_0173250796 /NCGR_PEP_ID=MMETSP1142-20121109/19782_1 /TAXON_ID=483371 /ORGANISM="non described non described, Strain CCMP2298" /LENGTH=45 /DNA_ID= /DNA_START= /DNA_END= /DNA_ORIENTATION=
MTLTMIASWLSLGSHVLAAAADSIVDFEAPRTDIFSGLKLQQQEF